MHLLRGIDMSQGRGNVKRERKIKIIRTLFENKEATTDELVDALKEPKLKNPYAALTHPKNELRDEGIIEIDQIRIRQRVGAPHQCLRLKRNLSTIREIFENYRELRSELKDHDWICDLLIKKRLGVMDDERSTEIKKMLRLSPKFFKICLKRETIGGFVRRYIEHEGRQQPDNIWAPSIKDISKPSEMDLDDYKRFFMFCYFLDKLKYNVTPESTELLLQYEREVKAR